MIFVGWVVAGLFVWGVLAEWALFAGLAGWLAGSLVLWSFGFWMVLALESVLLFCLIDHDEGAWATLTLLLTLFLFETWGNLKVYTALITNPLGTLGLVGLYFVLGTLWSVAKWWFYVRDRKERYDEKKAKFLKAKGQEGNLVPANLQEEWAGVVESQKLFKPESLDHKARIMRWMTFWPWSAVWTIINDPVKKAFRAIYRQIQGTLQKIADRIYQDTESDLPEDARSRMSERDY